MQANSYSSPGNDGGNLESVHDQLSILEPEATPFVSLVAKGTASATLTETVCDNLRAARTKGSKEGTNAKGGNNKAKNRARFGNYCHRVFDEFGVTDVQQAVTKKGGNAVTDDEYGDAKAKAYKEIKRDMEAICLSNVEMQGGSDDDMITRGFFKWIQNTAQATNPVPEKYRTPAASLLHGAFGSIPLFTENELNAVLKSLVSVYGDAKTFQLLAGLDVVDTIDRFSRINESTTNARYHINEPSGSKTISMEVSIFKSSFGRLEVQTDLFVRFGADDVSGNAKAGAIINKELWELQFLEEMMASDERDQGGGPWGWMRGMFANMCRNPRGNAAIYPD